MKKRAFNSIIASTLFSAGILRIYSVNENEAVQSGRKKIKQEPISPKEFSRSIKRKKK